MEIEILPGEYEVLPPEKPSVLKKFYHQILKWSEKNGGWKLVLGLCLFFYVLMFFLPYPAGLSLKLPLDPMDAKTTVFGSNLATLIQYAEQYYRFITANFLHFGLIHLGSNLIGLFVIGGLLQKIWNARMVFILFLLTGVGANLLTFFWNSANSAGASGGVFGLMGGLLAYFLFNRNLDAVLRQYMLKQLAGILGLNLFIGLVFPNIDLVGHLGGLVSGVILGKLFLMTQFSKRQSMGFWIWGFLLLLVLYSLVWALISYFGLAFL